MGLEPETYEALDFIIFCDTKAKAMLAEGTRDGFIAENRFIRVELKDGKQSWTGKPLCFPIMYRTDGEFTEPVK